MEKMKYEQVMKIRFINTVCILALILASACKSDNTSQLKNKEMMITEKKNIGNVLALYPKPMTVVGAEVEGKVNWLVVGHTGIIGHDRVLVSMSKSHYTNQGIRKSKKLSINLVSREMLPQADYVGSVSGASVNKSGVFKYHWGENGTPVIDASPLTMECNVEDIFETEGFDNFICSIANTYAAPEVLDSEGKLDYTQLNPVLFEFPTYSYIATGEIIGKCRNLDKLPGMCAKKPMTADGIVRLSKIEVYPQYLDEYMKYATEVGEISLRTEPGVLTMYAVGEKENPCKITILETYASREAYEKHIASEHFQKYKQGTLHMVKSLVLSDQTPLNPANRINNFIQ
jgi:flavin reductase (DIM6/NTAB) family NADH-FMN oxidoreductase RutF/quinol monooxygenase YgiN